MFLYVTKPPANQKPSRGCSTPCGQSSTETRFALLWQVIRLWITPDSPVELVTYARLGITPNQTVEIPSGFPQRNGTHPLVIQPLFNSCGMPENTQQDIPKVFTIINRCAPITYGLLHNFHMAYYDEYGSSIEQHSLLRKTSPQHFKLEHLNNEN